MDRTQSSSSVGSALKKIESYQYPNTHVGHLNDTQGQSLESFKSYCEKQGYFKPVSQDSPASHDDETLLRYLRARKFVVPDAFKQLKDTEDWRTNNKIDELYDTIDVKEYDESRKLYPQWTGRRDRRGIPVYVFEVAPLNSKRMSAYDRSVERSPINNNRGSGTIAPKLLRLFALYENLTKFVMPLCSAVPDRPYPETPVSQSNNIVDISGVGLKQFWNLKQHMGDASQLATAHYPETLDRIFIVGAPSFFPTVWNWIKSWFDPITVSKIFILSKSNTKSTLEHFIDRSNIPKKYGGTLEWVWGELPSVEPDIERNLHWEVDARNESGKKGFPPGPIKWRKTPEGDLVACAMGSVDGKQRDHQIARIAMKDQELNLGQLKSALPEDETSKSASQQLAAGDGLYLSGSHTHPIEGEENFPTSGDTPSSERSEETSLGKRELPAPYQKNSVGNSSLSQSESQDNDLTDGRRTGTSLEKYEAQQSTHAAGQVADGKPATVSNGDGDTTRVVEPLTIGQAPKDTGVAPGAQEQQTEMNGNVGKPSYVEQAKETASTAINTVAEAVGYRQESTEEEEKSEKKQENGDEVDQLEAKDIEDFLRSKAASPQNQAKSSA